MSGKLTVDLGILLALDFMVFRERGSCLVEFLGLALQAVEDGGIFLVISHGYARPADIGSADARLGCTDFAGWRVNGQQRVDSRRDGSGLLRG